MKNDLVNKVLPADTAAATPTAATDPIKGTLGRALGTLLVCACAGMLVGCADPKRLATLEAENVRLRAELEQLRPSTPTDADGGTRRARLNCPAGTRIEESKELLPNHRRIEIERCVDAAGVPEGPFVAFFRDGTRQREGTYRQGKLDGEVVSYDPDGTQRSRAMWKAGSRQLGVKDASVHVELRGVEDKGGFARFDLKVRNDSPYLIHYFSLDVRLRDKKGAPLGQSTTFVTGLRPGRSAAPYLMIEHKGPAPIQRVELAQKRLTVEIDHEPAELTDEIAIVSASAIPLMLDVTR